MKQRVPLIIVLLGALLCLAGCTGSGNPRASVAADVAGGGKAQTASLIEPEELISRQEAEQLLGIALKEGEKSQQAAVGQKLCFYAAQDEGGRYLQIGITQTAFLGNANQTPEKIYAALKDGLSETSEQSPVEGIGDEYFFGTPGLHILRDGYYLSVSAGGLGSEKVREVLEQAGALAVEKLGKLPGR